MSHQDLNRLQAAAEAAWLFTLPLIEVATTRSRALAAGVRMNTLVHKYALADHRSRGVTTPNNDTLYSTAQLDLAAGPVTFVLPAAGTRYVSLALMDAYTNNFAVLGTRTTGPGGGIFTLVGPTDAAYGPNVVRAPTRHVWALARVLVDGPADLAAARAVQHGISLQGPPVDPPEPFADRGAPWPAYFLTAARLMAFNQPQVTDWAILGEMAPLGLSCFRPDRFTTEERMAIEAGVTAARAAVRKGGLTSDTRGVDEGWSYPDPQLGVFGQDYRQRASVALSGLAALPIQEAMYMRARQPMSRDLFDGSRPWRLHFPAHRLPPVDGFWSLSLYEAMADGQFFFTANALGRYAIGERTEGLAFNPDGSLDLWIGAEDPGAGRRSNWLPAPSGPFALFLRAYLPRPDLLIGRYRLPPVAAA